MRKRSRFVKEMVQSINALNTLSGGVTEPQIHHHKLADHHEIDIRIPGLNQRDLKIEVHNNWLTVFYSLDLPSGEEIVNVPRVVFNKSLPYYIDVKKITADSDDRWLTIHLPFNELADGYHRKISIGQ